MAIANSAGSSPRSTSTIHQANASARSACGRTPANWISLRARSASSIAPRSCHGLFRAAESCSIRYKAREEASDAFTDPYQCRCRWVGQEPQYERYRRLEAEEMLPTIELTGIEAGPDWFDDVGAW